MPRFHVLNVPTLHKLFRQHNDQYPGLLCLMNTIWKFILQAQLKDLKKKIKIFRKWEKDTVFNPKPCVEPCAQHWADNPLHESTIYHSKYFFRRAHSIGVILATQAFMNGKVVFVVWTYNRKAYIFDYATLSLTKILNRQNTPYETWMRHLEGTTATRMEHEHEEDRRSSEILFHDLIVPFYGSDPMLRDPSRMRGISNSHIIWGLIREVSYRLPIPDANRKIWHSLHSAGPYSNTV